MSTRPKPRTQAPLPIQNVQWSKEHFEDPGLFNVVWQQAIKAVQALQGAGGPTVLRSGVDVQGAVVTGLGKPQSPSDAISSGHASTQYSAAAQQPQLDIGGKNTLKGLAYCYAQTQKNAAAVASIPTTYTGGGFINLFGALLQFGSIADMDTAVFPMAFPTPFLTAVQALGGFTTGPNDRITYVPTPPTLTDFTLANNGTGAGAYWVALGY
jgi:hypothetical protein